MSKKKSSFNKLTWIITELIIGLGGLIYGLYGTIKSIPDIKIVYIVVLSLGAVLLIIAILQINNI